MERCIRRYKVSRSGKFCRGKAFKFLFLNLDNLMVSCSKRSVQQWRRAECCNDVDHFSTWLWLLHLELLSFTLFSLPVATSHHGRSGQLKYQSYNIKFRNLITSYCHEYLFLLQCIKKGDFRTRDKHLSERVLEGKVGKALLLIQDETSKNINSCGLKHWTIQHWNIPNVRGFEPWTPVSTAGLMDVDWCAQRYTQDYRSRDTR